MISRIDNIFFNTSRVDYLAASYSRALKIPVRREQVLTPGLMWAEINVGGMELSFRKAGGTPIEHPYLMDQFVEMAPGNGATISFEISDSDEVRALLESRGVRFH